MLNERYKILVVDDERVIASTLATIFESSYKTATAFSGEEAIQVASSFQPDCIVSDVMMGAMNGIEAAILILGVLPRCKILFISGNAPCSDLLENARARGFVFEILQKPVSPKKLLGKISQVFSQLSTDAIVVGKPIGIPK